jgi:hypothetical protein
MIPYIDVLKKLKSQYLRNNITLHNSTKDIYQDPDPAKRMHFTELLVLLRSREGISIRELELGSPASLHSFDEVAADIRLMMPSSQYSFKSNSISRGSEESPYISSSVTQAETKRNMLFFKRS